MYVWLRPKALSCPKSVRRSTGAAFCWVLRVSGAVSAASAQVGKASSRALSAAAAARV